MKLNDYEKLMSEACDRLAAAQDENRRLSDALKKAQKIIEREFPNGQTAIDIRNALAISSGGQADDRAPKEFWTKGLHRWA